MVSIGEFFVNKVYFYGVEVGSLTLVLQDLHCFMNGAWFPNPGQMHQIRCIQTNMPGLQQDVCRADGTALYTRV